MEALHPARPGPAVPHCGHVLRPFGDLSISSYDTGHIYSGQNIKVSRNIQVNQVLWFRLTSCLRLEVGSWWFPDASLPASGAFRFTVAGRMPSVWVCHCPCRMSVLLKDSIEANPRAPQFSYVLLVNIRHTSPPASVCCCVIIYPFVGQNFCRPISQPPTTL